MDYFLCVIGMVMIVEGFPYFAFPQKMRIMILAVLEMSDDFFEELKTILKKESIDKLVIGMPFSMTGKRNHRTELTEQFAKRLDAHISIPIVYQDERLTSKAAGRLKKKGRLDALAAADILQQYLEKHAA